MLFWHDFSTPNIAAGHVNLVMALDTKIQDDITALHVAASYLHLSLNKGFSFVKDADEWCSLSEQAVDIAKRMPRKLQRCMSTQ